MTNEDYLVVSYFLCAALCAALGVLTYFFLRRPFRGVIDASRVRGVGSTLSRLFPCGFVLAAILGFVSVSYQGCERDTYRKIVESRRYLVQKNQEQISAALLSILLAVLFWDAVVLLILRDTQRARNGS